MSRKFGVIGVGNMAKSILTGILSSQIEISEFILFDQNTSQYNDLPPGTAYRFASNIAETVQDSDCILLSVKPQNFPEVLNEIKKAENHAAKLYISIAAGIASEQVSRSLDDACVIRVLPNLPMTIGMGVSLICKNDQASHADISFVQDVFCAAGSIMMINENDMNAMIGVTSSSPAYVFQFIHAIYEGALQQNLPDQNLIDVICDVLIGSATLLKRSKEDPKVLISRVASKGGTTQRALDTLHANSFDQIVADAMKACTDRANELGSNKS